MQASPAIFRQSCSFSEEQDWEQIAGSSPAALHRRRGRWVVRVDLTASRRDQAILPIRCDEHHVTLVLRCPKDRRLVLETEVICSPVSTEAELRDACGIGARCPTDISHKSA